MFSVALSSVRELLNLSNKSSTVQLKRSHRLGDTRLTKTIVCTARPVSVTGLGTQRKPLAGWLALRSETVQIFIYLIGSRVKENYG